MGNADAHYNSSWVTDYGLHHASARAPGRELPEQISAWRIRLGQFDDSNAVQLSAYTCDLHRFFELMLQIDYTLVDSMECNIDMHGGLGIAASGNCCFLRWRSPK